jgi:adenosylmethionine---8-amino-7-oxononanoate aminotransferase
MKDYESFPPLPIAGAEGPYLLLQDGRRLIDTCSSWWCKSLGHGHPRLRAALVRQAHAYEHVILANTSQEPAVALAERLAQMAPNLNRVFFGGDGSTAVEIATKLALHAQRVKGQSQRTGFAALQNGYHGEGGLSLGLSDLGLYREPYHIILPSVTQITGLPYRTGPGDVAWMDASIEWSGIEAQLNAQAETLCAVFVEPVLQGAGGMRLYSPDLLRRLRAWTSAHGVYLIADEILTGFHRTGPELACQHAGITPDLLCLSKGLTAGWLPLSATLIHEDIYQLFYHDYGQGRDFLHSNTFAGNALACAVALEALQVYADENISQQVTQNAPRLHQAFAEMAEATGRLKNIRQLGMMVAADLDLPQEPRFARAGLAVFKAAITRGALWRPLGNTLYWLPPLNSPPEIGETLRDIGIAALRETFP